MGFLKNLFHHENEYDSDYDYDDYDWEDAWNADDYDGTDLRSEQVAQTFRQPLDTRDENVREQFVRNCLEEMREASHEMDRLSREYDMVTSYLTDMEEVEAIPAKDRKEIEAIANHIRELRKTHDTYVTKESVMTDSEYMRIDAIADEVEEGLHKLEEAEDMKDKIKKDLSRLDKERHAYDYRKRELTMAVENSRGIAMITMGASVVLILILFFLQIGLKMDVTIGYYITVIILAISLTVIYIRYTNYVSERRRVVSTTNELILLENKVKIRYVNNKNLLDYLYEKYQVNDAWTLRDLYDRYKKEYEMRSGFQKNEAVYQEELARLVRELRKFRVKDPEIWLHQVDALVDPREMVELRHGYIGRRQKLRKQMEYNQDVATDAGEEIKKLIAKYPKSADSILAIVNAYEE